MKSQRILFITSALEPYSGWGKYSSDLVNALRKEGIEVTSELISNPLAFKKHYFLAWWQAWQIHRKYKNHRFDLVHCAIEPYATIARLASKWMEVPYVLTLHGSYSVVLLRHPVYSYFQHKAFRDAKKLIAVSQYTASRVREIINPDNLTVIPNGYYGEITSHSRTLSSPRIILGVGALKHRKGYHLVIEALAKIKDCIRPFKYYIVGDINDKEYLDLLHKSIKRHALEDEVIITGRLPEDELDKLYQTCHLFALTPVSEGDYFEGFGLVYLEANAKGIPVIAMKGSGAEEAVSNGSSGLLVRNGDIDDLSSKIKEILNDPNEYSRLSEGAIEWAKKMSWAHVVNQYKSVY